MKQYFAKYLPVEGEIKVGDWVIHPGNPPSPITRSNISLVCSECRKAQLFLCSRDIQVGDIVWPKYLVFEDGSEGRPEGNWMHLSAITSGSFKVIGVMSSFATYVKEGDEFDQHEIQRFGRSYQKDGNKTAEETPYKSQYYDYYLIKGPCGHFH